MSWNQSVTLHQTSQSMLTTYIYLQPDIEGKLGINKLLLDTNTIQRHWDLVNIVSLFFITGEGKSARWRFTGMRLFFSLLFSNTNQSVSQWCGLLLSSLNCPGGEDQSAAWWRRLELNIDRYLVFTLNRLPVLTPPLLHYPCSHSPHSLSLHYIVLSVHPILLLTLISIS